MGLSVLFDTDEQFKCFLFPVSFQLILSEKENPVRPTSLALSYSLPMEKSQLHTPRVLSPRFLLKTHWWRRSEGRDLWLSHPMGFEKETRSGDTRSMQLRSSHCLTLTLPASLPANTASFHLFQFQLKPMWASEFLLGSAHTENGVLGSEMYQCGSGLISLC